MSKERFLLRMLAALFVFQIGTFGAGFIYCARSGGLKSCPDIGDRYENTFNVAIATTLALITGSTIKNDAKP